MSRRPMQLSRMRTPLGRHSSLHRRIYKTYPIKEEQNTEDPDGDHLLVQKQRIAFHVAGHSTAIYLNIKAKNLPPAFSQIMLKALNSSPAEGFNFSQSTRYEGRDRLRCGRLFEMLPTFNNARVADIIDSKKPSIKQSLIVFEADIVSLLAGSLAEAKYVATTDNEVFSQRLINLKALNYYGGESDLPLVHDYLLSFSDYQQKRDEKLEALFVIAFNFINDPANWAAITKLAHSILESQEGLIDVAPVALRHPKR